MLDLVDTLVSIGDELAESHRYYETWRRNANRATWAVLAMKGDVEGLERLEPANGDDDARMHRQLMGLAFSQAGDPDMAVAQLEADIARNGDSLLSHVNLLAARLSAAHGKPDVVSRSNAARIEWQTYAAGQAPDHLAHAQAEIATNLVVALVQEGRPSDAYELAIGESPAVRYRQGMVTVLTRALRSAGLSQEAGSLLHAAVEFHGGPTFAPSALQDLLEGPPLGRDHTAVVASERTFDARDAQRRLMTLPLEELAIALGHPTAMKFLADEFCFAAELLVDRRWHLAPKDEEGKIHYADEDRYTDWIVSFFKARLSDYGLAFPDQTFRGESASGKRPGRPDMVLEHRGRNKALYEAFRCLAVSLSNTFKGELQGHLAKAVRKYDAGTGMLINAVYYVKTDFEGWAAAYQGYLIEPALWAPVGLASPGSAEDWTPSGVAVDHRRVKLFVTKHAGPVGKPNAKVFHLLIDMSR